MALKYYVALVLLLPLIISSTYGQCTATIANGNGSFNDNQIGFSSSHGAATIQATPPVQATSQDGGAFMQIVTTGSVNENVNITMNGLVVGGIYEVNWEVIHGLVNTGLAYPDGANYTVNILQGNTTIVSQNFTIDNTESWLAQNISFTASATDMIFQILLISNDFNAGTYKMGLDGMTIECDGTTRPCDLEAPTFTRK